MCDELAQTIAAPPPVVPVKPGKISPLDCGDTGPSRLGAPAAPEPPRQLTAPQLPDRTLAVAYGLPSCPRHDRVPAGTAEPGERAGHYASVYRPPRG
jgi:hypothetical protein